MWRHIARRKLQLTEELAWLYFETFDLLTARPPEERLGWAEALSQCSDYKELDHQRSKVTSGQPYGWVPLMDLQHLIVERRREGGGC